MIRLVLLLCIVFTTDALAQVATDKAALLALSYNGDERNYRLYIPDNIQKAKRVPLVIVLHGGGGNGAAAEKMSGFSKLARQEGFIAVYPNGNGIFKDKFLTWNVRHCCKYAMRKNSDDVGFINALIDHLINNYPVDERAIYVTGMSNGAMLTHRLGIELQGKIAAIASVSGGLFGDEVINGRKNYAMPALMLNGVKDTSFPFNGGQSQGLFPKAWDGTPLMSVLYQMQFWGQVNSCNPAIMQQEINNGTVTRYNMSCPKNQDVVLYAVNNGGHTWFGGKKGFRLADPESHDIDATKVIWGFFKEHRKP